MVVVTMNELPLAIAAVVSRSIRYGNVLWLRKYNSERTLTGRLILRGNHPNNIHKCSIIQSMRIVVSLEFYVTLLTAVCTCFRVVSILKNIYSSVERSFPKGLGDTTTFAPHFALRDQG